MQINAPLSQLRPSDFTESMVCSEQLIIIKYSQSPLDNVVKRECFQYNYHNQHPTLNLHAVQLS